MTRVVSHVEVESINVLLRRLGGAQKSNRGTPGYSRWVNRPAGRLIAAIAYKSGRTPNQVTASSALMSFAAITLVAALRPTPASGILIAAILALAYALDSADGQLARLRGVGGPRGEWFDHVVDCVKSSAIHLAVAICWFRFYAFDDASWLLVPLAFCLQSATWFFTIILTDKLRPPERSSKATADDEGRSPVARSLMMLPADYGVLCLTFSLLGFQPAFVTVYSVLLAINVCLLAVALPSWYRSLG